MPLHLADHRPRGRRRPIWPRQWTWSIGAMREAMASEAALWRAVILQALEDAKRRPRQRLSGGAPRVPGGKIVKTTPCKVEWAPARGTLAALRPGTRVACSSGHSGAPRAAVKFPRHIRIAVLQRLEEARANRPSSRWCRVCGLDRPPSVALRCKQQPIGESFVRRMEILMQVLNITGTARRWNRLQVSAAVAVFLAFDNLASTAFQGVQYVVMHKFEPFNPTDLIFPVLSTAVALFVIRQFWTHGILFNVRSIGKLRYVYWLLCAVGVGLMLLMGLLLVQLAENQNHAADLAVALWGGFVLAGFGFWNLRMIKKLRRET